MTPSALGWRLLSDVRPNERGRFGLFALATLLFNLAQTMGLAGSEGLLLSSEGAGALPIALIVAAAVATLASAIYAGLVGQVRNDRVAIGVFGLSATIVLASIPLLDRSITRYALFAAFFAIQAVGLIHLRTFAIDYFDTLASKRVFPLLAMCGSVGGAIGGALAAWLPRVVPTPWLIGAWAVGLACTGAWIIAGRGRLHTLKGASDEDDAPEARQLRLALRWLRRPGLERHLALSVAFMVVAMSILHFISAEILVERFVTADRLAAFLGLYLGVSNGVEIVLARWGTPLLLRRFGVPGAQLVHPASSALALAAVGALPGLATAVLARANRELLENALAGEVRNLAYNAVPARLRGSIRALVEGGVFYGSLSLGGLALLAVGDDVSIRWLAGAGLVAVTVYAVGAARVARGYLKRIQEELREGSLETVSIETASPRVLAELADEWVRIVETGDRGEITPAILELTRTLARRGHAERLLRATTHPDPRMRAAVAAALGSADTDAVDAALLGLLQDEDASVREAAVSAISERASAPDAERQRALKALLEDASAEVRICAALALGASGRDALTRMTESDEVPLAAAALRRLPGTMLAQLRARCEASSPEIRAAAITRLAELGVAPTGLPIDLEAMLVDEHPDLRRAAIVALSSAADASGAEALIASLVDREPEIRRLAEERLVAMGDAAVPALAAHAGCTTTLRARAIVRALGAIETERSRSALQRAFTLRVQRSWRCQLAVLASPEDTRVGERFLRLALGNRVADDVRQCLAILAQLEGRSVVNRIERTLQHGRADQCADALELLGHLGERGASASLALLLESGPIADKIGGRGARPVSGTRASEILAIAQESGDPWIERGWRLTRAEDRGIIQREVDEMNRLLELRRVPLFCHLSLDELQAIAQQTELLGFLPGEIVVREGEPGEELYVLIEGEVDALIGYGTPGEFCASHLVAPTSFGELSVIDGAPRSATIRVTHEARLLALKGSVLRDIMREVPQVAIDLLRAVTAKVRTADARALSSGGPR